MKKMLLILVILLLSGCGEKKEDYQNAKDSKKYIVSEVSQYYDRDNIVILNETSLDNESYLYEMYFENEPDVVFQGITCWEVGSAIPKRSYSAYWNYQEVKNNFVLKHVFSQYPKLIYSAELKEKNEMNCSSKIDRYSYSLEILDRSYLSELPEVLYRLNSNEEFISGNFFDLKYGEKVVSVSTNNFSEGYDLSYYQEKVNELFS